MILKVCFGRRDEFYMVGSQIIRAVEETDYSHAWIELDGMVFEAVFPKSHCIKKMDHKYTTTHEFSFFMHDENKSAALNFLYNLMDIRYAVSQLFSIFAGYLNRWINKKISKKNINGKSEIICTELCARFLSEFYAIDFKQSFDNVDLKELFYKCKLLDAVHGGYK